MSIGNVGQFPPLLSLPQQRCPTAATGTSSRLACMKDSPLFFSRSEDLGTQRFGPAVEYFLECLTNIGAHVIPIPRISETNGMSVVSGRRLTGFLAGLRRRITRFMSTSQRELHRSADFFRGGREAGTIRAALRQCRWVQRSCECELAGPS